MRALKGFARMRTIFGTAALLVLMSTLCFAQYGYPQSDYPQSNDRYDRYGRSNDIAVTQAPVLEYADPQTITIMWRTNVNANSVIRFGTDPNNLGMRGQVVQLDDNSRTHRVEMRNRFQPGTTYYFQLISDRGDGNPIVSPVFAAQTPQQGAAPIRDQQLMIAGNRGYNNSYDDDDDRDVYYRNRNNNHYANNGWRHRNENSYAGNRGYGYSGNRSYGYERNNLPQGDVTSNIQITRPPMLQMLSDTVAVITWRTNAPSSSIVHFGTDPNSLTQAAQAPWGETFHTVTVQNLQPGTRYFFNVSSGQAEGTGTSTNSGTMNFTTRPQGARPLQRVQPQQ